jgi:prevent-host-death family protein
MKALSSLLRDDLVSELREQTDAGAFVGIDFATAMRFILADGVVPADDLPVESLLRLEEWVRSAARERLSFTATELKNKTGLILERVVAGEAIFITRHGRTIAEIRPVAR